MKPRKIRQSDDFTKAFILWASVLFIMILILGIWAWTLPAQLGTDQNFQRSAKKNDLKSLSALFGGFKNDFQKAVSGLNYLKNNINDTGMPLLDQNLSPKSQSSQSQNSYPEIPKAHLPY